MEKWILGQPVQSNDEDAWVLGQPYILYYEEAVPQDITKGLAYEVVTENDITKGLAYAVKTENEIQKTLEYRVTTQDDITKGLEYRVITTPADTEKGLEYIVNPPPPQEISSGKVVVVSDETEAAGPEDIAGLTFDIELKNAGYIMAFMSLTSEMDTNGAIGYFSLNINGVDSPVIRRKHILNKNGNVEVVYRSGLLSAGTYTVKGRHHSTPGQVLTSKNITLVAFPTEDEGGNEIRSVYDTVATDSVVGDTPEDIDGLTQELTTQSLSFVFAMIVGSVSATAASLYRLILSMNGKEVDVDRTLPTSDVGAVGLVGRTELPEHAGAIIIKGKHASEAGITGTIAPSILVGLDLSTVSGGTGYVIPSGNRFIEGALLSTTSIALEDIPGAEIEVILTQEAHIFAVITLASESEKDNKENYFALNINGVDFEECSRTSNGKLDKATVTVVARTTSKLAAGTYTIKGRWRTTIGNTLRAINDLSLVAIGLETTTQDLPTHIDRSLDYKVVAPVDINKTLEYRVITPKESTKGLEYRVITYTEITKGLEYRVVTQSDTTKGLAYQVITDSELTKGLEYRVITQQEVQKALGYMVKTYTEIQRALAYAVETEQEITKGLGYAVITSTEATRGLEYKVETAIEIQKGLQYIVVKPVGITKALEYILQIDPYCPKDSPYSKFPNKC